MNCRPVSDYVSILGVLFMTSKEKKVFGIGLSKTGTTSLTQSLRLLDHKAVHFPFFHLKPQKDSLELNYQKLDRWDAMVDTPIPYFYKNLDRYYPGSKFILTIRDIDEWLDSCEKNHIWPGEYVHDKAASNFLYMKQLLQLHHALYGSVWFDRKRFSHFYKKHVDGILSYFSSRSDDLLIYNISDGDGWEPLCEFLGKQVPEVEFPRKNVGKHKLLKKETRHQLWKIVSFMHLGHRVNNKFTPVRI